MTFALLLNAIQWGSAGAVVLLLVSGGVWIWRLLPVTGRLAAALFMGCMVGLGFSGKDIGTAPEMARELVPKFMTSVIAL